MTPQTELCKLALKYGADKCPQIGHMYTPFYYEYFLPIRDKVKKVLEFGIGNKRMAKMIPGYVMGPSIRMWRDFFPNAMVYGADIAKESFFKDERIETYYCNEDDPEQIKELIKKIGSDIDIVIDDACHKIDSQMNLFKYMMPLLDPGVIYVCEDCRRTRQMMKTFPEYESFSPKLPPNEDMFCHDGIVVFKYKQI